jgi:hypothetical protein
MNLDLSSMIAINELLIAYLQTDSFAYSGIFFGKHVGTVG